MDHPAGGRVGVRWKLHPLHGASRVGSLTQIRCQDPVGERPNAPATPPPRIIAILIRSSLPSSTPLVSPRSGPAGSCAVGRCWIQALAHPPLGTPPHPASSPALALGNPVQLRSGPTASHSTPSLTAPVGQLYVPANSRQLRPRGALFAYRLSNSARHDHCGPPSSCLCGYLTPPSPSSIGIGPGPFASPYSSSLVSTPAPITSVDSGLSSNGDFYNLNCSTSAHYPPGGGQR